MFDYTSALKDLLFRAAILRYPESRGEGNEAVNTTARLIAKLAEKASKEFRQQQAEEGRLLRSKANYFIYAGCAPYKRLMVVDTESNGPSRVRLADSFLDSRELPY